MTRTFAAVAIFSLTLSGVANAAEDNNTAAAGSAVPAAALPLWAQQPTGRPAALPLLYASYAALQAYDVYSTRQALALGAREANPMMQGVVGNTGAFVALKAGVAVGTIMFAEHLWKTNKVAAIAVMVASNSIAATVAARNARTLRQLR